MTPEITSSWMQKLACPLCETELRSEPEILICAKCNKSWPVIDGIPRIISDFPYWGEIPQEKMAIVNRQARAESWKSALLGSPDPAVKRASEMILNLARANWYLLTDLPKDSRVLDLGAGMGTNSHALALQFGEVIATEPVAERVQFMSERFRQENLDNVRIIRTSLWDLPFPKESFDLIVMNGVLEWVAQGRDGNPQTMQEAALKNAIRLLRPGGILYLGIENRLAAGYFVGYPDPHSGMPWVTILPRLLAGLYARWKGASGYANYLYSSWGYRKLLRKCGFSSVACYLAIPSYNEPRFYLPMHNNVFRYFSEKSTRRGIPGFARECLLRCGLLKYLQYSFALLATK